MIRILHAIDSLQRGGIENTVVNLVNRLPKSEFVQGICCLNQSGPMADNLEAPTDIFELHRKFRDPHLLYRYHRIIKEWQPDIVHCRGWYVWPDTVVASSFIKKRPTLLWSIHGFHTSTIKWALRRRLPAKLLSLMTDNYLTVSLHCATAHAPNVGISPRKFKVIYNGVDCQRFRPRQERQVLRESLAMPEDAFVVVVVANLKPVKNHLTLLRAISLRDVESKGKYFFVGDGSMRTLIEAEIGRLGVGNDVQLVGYSGQVAEYLAAADAFVLPSHLEGSSNALLEAMASGLPVIASKVGGNPEIVENGVNGFLCRVDAAEEFACALDTLERDTLTRHKMGVAARQRASEKFSIEAMVSEYSNYYRSIFRGGAAVASGNASSSENSDQARGSILAT